MKLLLDNYTLSLNKLPKHIFRSVYFNVNQSYDEVKELTIKCKFHNTFNNEIISSLINGRYVGVTHLKQHVKNCIGYYKITAKYKERHITIYFVIMNIEDLDLDIQFYSTTILAYIIFCSKMAPDDCSKNLSIYIYLTHFKKELHKHDKVISTKNVNSGVTYSCSRNNEVCVYRKEEFIKVVFHELIHSLGIDEDMFQQSKFKNEMNNLFHLSTTGNYFEAYTEFMAVNFYIYFTSFFLTNTLEECYKLSNTLLHNEVYFSMFQLNKVLSHNGLSYNDLLANKNTDLYRENTNVFSYYVLKTILLYHNFESLYFFWEKEKHLAKFIKKLAYNKMFILDTIKFNNKIKNDFLEKTMRMTILPEI